MIERWMPAAASGHASALDGVLLSVHMHMLLIFVLWLAVFAFALIRFRSGANPTARQEGVRGLWPAIAIGLIIVGDVIILVTQALPAWAARNEPPPPGPEPVEIHVTAEQFAWNIHYSGPDRAFGRTRQDLISASNPVGIDRDDPAAKDDIGLLNVLMLQVNCSAVRQLTSRDVIRSFKLNELRVKLDSTRGMNALLSVMTITTGLGDRLLAAYAGSVTTACGANITSSIRRRGIAGGRTNSPAFGKR